MEWSRKIQRRQRLSIIRMFRSDNGENGMTQTLPYKGRNFVAMVFSYCTCISFHFNCQFGLLAKERRPNYENVSVSLCRRLGLM